MGQLKLSTARNLAFLMVDSADHLTGKTGLTVAVTLSKDAGAFAAAGGAITEISSGWYKIALSTTDTNTLGDLALHCTATGADATDFREQVVSLLPGDAVTVGTNNDKTGYSLTQAFPTNFSSMVINASGRIDVGTWLGAAVNALIGGRVDSNAQVVGDKTGYALSTAGVQAIWDALTSALTTVGSIGKLLVDNINATISSRLASASYTAPDNASIASILTNTDVATSTRATPAQVKTQVVAAINTDTYAESSAVPAATDTLVNKIVWLATLARNKITQTATTQTLRNDGDAGNVSTSAVSDDGTTFTRNKWA